MELILNGIDRGNSNDNGVQNAASLIINARKKGSTWEYVGDKEYIGYATNASNYSGYYWHYKFGNTLVIAYNSNTRKVDVINIKKLNNQTDKRFINASGTGDFTLSAEEIFLSIHSLNNIIIIDTDKNKYYFVWNEEKKNFEALPDLPELNISVSYDTENVLLSGGVGFSKSVTIPLNTIDASTKSDFMIACSSIITAFDNSVKNKLMQRQLLWKGFRIVAAFEMADGTVVKTSNIIPFIDRLYVDYDNKAVDMLEFQFSYDTLSYLLQMKNIFMGYSGESTDPKFAVNIPGYKNVKVIISGIYDVLEKWISNNLISNISVYISNPSTFLNVENQKVFYFNIKVNPDNNHKYLDAYTYVGYDNDAAYKINVPYYKIGEFDIKSKKTAFEIKSKMLKDVINNKALSVSQDLSRKYASKVNMVYNGMIHKSSVLNLISTSNLVHKGVNNAETSVSVDIQINNKWSRIGIGKADNRLGQTAYVFIQMSNIQIFSPSVTQANLIIRHPNTGKYHIFKILKLDKSTFTNSLFVFPIIDFEQDKATPGGYDQYKEFEVSQPGWFPSGSDKQFNIYDYESIRVKVSLSDLSAMPVVNYTTTDSISYEDTNRLQLSATNNPFIYPSERSYRFGSEHNKVIASESSTVQLSDSKFGQLPLYVFSKQGIWIGETALGDIAYSTFHLLDNLECFDNPKLIQRVLGGVVFGAVNGIYVISNTSIKRLSQGLEGRVVPHDVEGIEQRISGLNIAQSCAMIYDLMKDYLSDNSFCVFDKKENELLFIDPDKDFSFVLQLDYMSWTTRKDGYKNMLKDGHTLYTRGILSQFTDSIIIDNEYKLIGRDNSGLNRDLFFDMEETDRSKTIDGYFYNNNAVVFISGIIMNKQYVKLEHIISRFSQLTNTSFDSHILIIGSRDGIEWKVLNHSSMVNVSKNISGQEMRRCFSSSKYFQIVYIRMERSNQNTENRKQSYFERFSFDISNSDSAGKLR
jgi:hypothetical protein